FFRLSDPSATPPYPLSLHDALPILAPCLSLFSPLFAMRRPGVRIPSRPPSFKTTSRVPNSSYRGTLGLSSLPDSFRYLVIHPERHCLSAAASVNTSRY